MLVAMLGWMQNDFKDADGNVFMPESFTRMYKDKTWDVITQGAELALVHGIISPETFARVGDVAELATRQHADNTAVYDAVVGNMTDAAKRMYGKSVEEFIPEMRRMAQNGTTKAEEDFLLRLYGSKERIAAAMSKFAEDRKDIRLETQGVATEDEEGNVEGDYEGGTEVVPG